MRRETHAYVTTACWSLLLTLLHLAAHADESTPTNYGEHVAPIFRKYCNGCHNADDANGELVLDDFSRIVKGGEHGPVIVPGRPGESRMILVLEHKLEPFMPPEGSEGPTNDEIALLKAWIAAGARGPEGRLPLPTLDVPKVEPVGDVRRAIHAAAWSPDGKWIAVGRYGSVEILAGESREPVRTLDGLTGQVNDLGFSADGSQLLAASGEPGLHGEANVWSTADWQKQQTLRGHHDTLYSIAISPDGHVLATGSYDQTVIVWNADSATELHLLEGHNGAVFDLAFHPAGTILASASGDRTVKLWNVATGERLDTFGQPEKDQYALAFSPDGRIVAAGGVDNRIRVWQITKDGREGTNPLLFARFAHERPILRLAFSPDGRLLVSSAEDRTIKSWETGQFTQQRTLAGQSDWPAALAVSPDSRTLLVGRMDGSLETYPLASESATIERPDPLIREPLSLPQGELATSPQSATIAEIEPNDALEQAIALSVPGSVTGVLSAATDPDDQRNRKRSQTTHDARRTTNDPDRSPLAAHPDVDLYRFEAAQGQPWIIETSAARDKSPADTKIEVLHADGRPVERLLLRAVRDSYITFRPIGSTENQARVKNWEEMRLNQFLYMNGEVVKLFRAPQGPDSGFLFYTIRGQRRGYFDTSATIHALEDPVYIVEPYRPGTQLIDNGLPVFTLFYQNDDDADRRLGADSQLMFTAPADGSYLVRVTDIRGFGGDDYKYTLTVRHPQPGFSASVGPRDLSVVPGTGQRFTITLDRLDGFEGDVRVDVANVPEGYFIPTPIVIEAGHLEAQGVVFADAGAHPVPKERWAEVKLVAAASIGEKQATNSTAGFGEIKLGEKPRVVVKLEPDAESAPSSETIAGGLTIAPGTSIIAMLSIERNGFDGELKFDVDNLPHGVIVDDIGLSGVLIRAGEHRRRIFLTAADWVSEQTRSIHAVANGEGNPASRPIRLHVRRPESLAESR